MSSESQCHLKVQIKGKAIWKWRSY